MEIKNHDDFPELDHRAAPSFRAERDRVSDSPPVPRARPGTGDTINWGIFKRHFWGELLRHQHVQDWIAAVGANTAYIEPGSPWENGYIESFNARLRDELFNGEIFYTLQETKIIIESRRRHYNAVRPHASLGYKPPAPEVF